jgi:signal transduction histidine kinase
MLTLDGTQVEPRPETKGRSGCRQTVSFDQEQTTLVAQVSHELRGPLSAIVTALGLLHRHRDEAAMRAYVAGVLERQTKRMTHLVDDLLTLSRIGRGNIQLDRQPVEVAQLLERAVETVRPCIEHCDHRLEVVLPPERITLEADPIRLEQVVVNLLTNAAKYTNRGGHIGLAAERDGEYLILRVQDNGIGIEPEMLPYVFDLFWQSPDASKRSREGLGIGLALVRQFVELHGGSVKAFSAGRGQGSEFVVSLPLRGQ